VSQSHDNAGTGFRRGKTMACPHCGGLVSVGINVDLAGDLLPAGTMTNGTASGVLTDGEREVLAQAKRSGMLDAFRAALEGSRPAADLPADCSGLFLLFFKKATPKRVPQFAMTHFAGEFRPAQIEIWGAEGVAAVLADRYIKCFVPYRLLRGAPISSLGGRSGTTARLDADQNAFLEWIRTRHGYVAGRGAFFSSMRKRSIGEFARPVL